MENEKGTFCDFCNLAIYTPGKQYRTVAREKTATQSARVVHFHNRDNSDCWQKALAKAKNTVKGEVIYSYIC